MEQRIKLLIADDEQIMREGLQLVIDWEKYGFHIIGVASNGEKALRLCEENSPDLVITDIRMPVMDGLALTKEIVARYPGTRIIILSAYDDFKYAQKALSYGASEYLLKSELESERLLAAALKLAQEILQEQRLRTESQQMKRQLAEHLEEVRVSFCRSLLVAPHYPKQIEEQLAHLSLDLQGSDLILIHFCFAEACELLCPDLSYFQGTFIKKGYWVNLRPGCFAFLGNVTAGVGPRLTQEMKFINSKIQSSVANQAGSFYSPIFSGFEHVYQYNQMLQKYSQISLFYEKYGLYCCEKEPFHVESFPMMPLLVKLVQLTESSQIPLVMNLLRELCDSFSQHIYFPEDIKETLALICSILEEKAEQAELGAKEELRKIQQNFSHGVGTRQAIFQYQRLSRLLEETMSYGERLLQFIEKNMYPYHPMIKKAIQYIHKHLNEEISLNRIAGKIYCNPAYLSQLFKDQVHTNFSDFLMQARMRRAALLLTTTSLPVGEIAEQVGVPNQSYFSRSFIRFAGVQPSRYRQEFFKNTEESEVSRQNNR